MEEILSANKKKELTLDEFQKIAGNFSQLAQVSIGGGEPLIREDLGEILYIYTKISITKYFTLPTNGTFPDRMKISSILRALSVEVHDIIHDTVKEDWFIIPCEAGRKMLVITEEGVVRPCEIFDEIYGKLQDYNFDLSKLMPQHSVRENAKNI